MLDVAIIEIKKPDSSHLYMLASMVNDAKHIKLGMVIPHVDMPYIISCKRAMRLFLARDSDYLSRYEMQSRLDEAFGTVLDYAVKRKNLQN